MTVNVEVSSLIDVRSFVMTKPWQTAIWKKKRDEFLKGKSCEWCGSEKNLVIHHAQHFHGLKEYKKCITRFMQEYFARKDREEEKQRLLGEANKDVSQTYEHLCPICGSSAYARKTVSPKYKCKKCGAETDTPVKILSHTTQNLVRKNLRFLFFKQHKEEIDRFFAQQKEMADEEYRSFKDVMILCNRCHYAKEKGMVLCEVCKRRYHKPKYGKCWECFQKTKDGQEVANLNKPLAYTHPWCGKAFQILRKYWNIEANPQTCCIEHCDADPNSCEIAAKHWD